MKAKMKVKINKDALRQFFIDNGEKIVFAAVLFGSLAMLYGAWMQANYAKHPSQLVDNSSGAEQHIESTRVPDWTGWKVCISPDFRKLVEKSKYPIDEDVFAWTVLLDRPVVKQRKLRPQPELYAAQKLQGTAGVGAFSFQRQAEKGQPKEQQGVRYAVLTALVPLEQQKTAFQEAFREAAFQNHSTDEQPQYGGFIVQRAPVTGSPEQNPQWETIARSWTCIPETKQQWTKTDAEVVDPKFVIGKLEKNAGNAQHDDSSSPLVFPLGPLMQGAWGSEVAHPPEIPIVFQTKAADTHQPNGDAAAVAPTAKEAKNGEGPFFKDKEPTPQPEQTPAEAEKDQPPKYILLRFFDFTVKPGAAYRYQVKLVLKNPNYKVEPRYLADSKSAASQAIESPWSEPTGAIVVPPDIRILARAVTVSRPNESDDNMSSIFYTTNSKDPSRQTEPEGKVVVMQWMEDSGTTAHDEFSKILRGQNLDFHYVKHPHGPPGTRPQPIRVDFTTGALVVDLAGGDSFAGEMLILDQNGKLMAHNNIDDDEAYQKWEDKDKGKGTIKPATPPGTPPKLENVSAPVRAPVRPPVKPPKR